jgi:hypothetical protein
MRHPVVFGCMVAAFTFAAAGIGALAKDDGPATKTPIKHVVVIYQENTSFDHYFGTYPEALNPSGETQFKAAPGTPKPSNLLHPKDLVDQNPNFLLSLPFRLGPANAFTCSEDHGYSDEQSAADGGAMDMFQDTSHTGLEIGRVEIGIEQRRGFEQAPRADIVLTMIDKGCGRRMAAGAAETRLVWERSLEQRLAAELRFVGCLHPTGGPKMPIVEKVDVLDIGDDGIEHDR